LEDLKHVPATLVFYESPNRIQESIADALSVLGDRPAALARELTKIYEDCRHGTLSSWAQDANLLGTLKGECVFMIGPVHHTAANSIDVEDMLRKALESQSLKDAASFVASATGQPRKQIYDLALKINGQR
ncbi:MAG TPA: 16S rRNA (cytidine(1402)-2'-O)-methyltransferase, partial [Alphaproteobacteria bacterium]